MQVYVETYGCTANKSDETIVRGILNHHNHHIVTQMDDADLLILLTCTVIATTEQRMLSRLRVFQKTNKPMIISGCMASAQHELLKQLFPTAQLLPPQYIGQIDQLIQGKKLCQQPQNKTVLPRQFTQLTAPIMIAEGCMMKCSYCITHRARGKLRSYPVTEIYETIQNAIASGCKEIQLTAQDTASYGLDTGTNLGHLLKNITKIDGNYRIRVGMMNPYTTKKNLDDIILGFNHNNVYRFLHLPLQSGDNDILTKMKRNYTIEDFTTIISTFRKRYPDITVSTDVIVGFPGETETQFHHTIDALNRLQPDIINITRFSARPYTAAKTMKQRIPTHIVKKRSQLLTTHCQQLQTQVNKQHMGKQYTVLITEKGKNNTFVGRSENYKPIIIKEHVIIGSLVPVQVVDYSSINLFGKVI